MMTTSAPAAAAISAARARFFPTKTMALPSSFWAIKNGSSPDSAGAARIFCQSLITVISEPLPSALL
ncbi:MAG: hypothetical protein A3K15_09200 [Candidatus Edwardsbacteria bacterium GWE2_54_12]|nr:MAG: hypothetical protein A3K15_09200 [Candidatus Edwardsbacteria bacterium GWE2_54_12]